jgi:hypothetical protein
LALIHYAAQDRLDPKVPKDQDKKILPPAYLPRPPDSRQDRPLTPVRTGPVFCRPTRFFHP